MKGRGDLGSLTAPEWPGCRGEGASASDCQGVEALYPLDLTQNGHTKKDTEYQKIMGSGAHIGRERQGQRGADGPVTQKI